MLISFQCGYISRFIKKKIQYNMKRVNIQVAFDIVPLTTLAPSSTSENCVWQYV